MTPAKCALTGLRGLGPPNPVNAVCDEIARLEEELTTRRRRVRDRLRSLAEEPADARS
jgi:hypothetical protein